MTPTCCQTLVCTHWTTKVQWHIYIFRSSKIVNITIRILSSPIGNKFIHERIIPILFSSPCFHSKKKKKRTCNWEAPRRRALWIRGRGARCSGPSGAWWSSSRICSRPTSGWGIEGGWSRGQRRPGWPRSRPGNWGKGQWSWKDSSPFRRGSLCNRSSFARSGSPLGSLAAAPSDFSSLPARKREESYTMKDTKRK